MKEFMKRKSLILSILGVFILIVAIGGITFAFFNYTRTGTANTFSVGRISFTTSQNNTINLSNVFPISSSNLSTDVGNHGTVTINIEGDTEYTGGIEYKVTLEDVHNTVSNKEIPITVEVEATDLGTASSDYYNARGGEDAVYMVNSYGDAYEGKYVAVGYIPAGEDGVDGSIDITAYLDTNKVAISDTYNGEETDLMGTTNDWVMGREVITTTEWNSFVNSPLSFKVRVEANEGTWVEQEKLLTLKRLSTIQAWKDVRANITSIEFHKDGLAPASYATSFDATATTSSGDVTVYTVDDGLGNGTYKAIIVANGVIYAPKNIDNMFMNMSNLVAFNSKNFKVDNVTSMNKLFNGCSNLTSIDNSLAIWNVNNVKTMIEVFYGCTKLQDISALSNWDVSNVTRMSQMFSFTKLSNLDSLNKWNVSNVTTMQLMFNNCSNLTDASGINNWNVNPNASFLNMFTATPSHPEFTKVTGTWSGGTFTPTVNNS